MSGSRRSQIGKRDDRAGRSAETLGAPQDSDKAVSPLIPPEMKYCTFVSNMFWKATLPFSRASTISPSRIDSRDSAQSAGSYDGSDKELPVHGPTSGKHLCRGGSKRVLQRVFPRHVAIQRSRPAYSSFPRGRAIRYDEVSVHASAALRMVPSPPSTMKYPASARPPPQKNAPFLSPHRTTSWG